MSAAAIGIIGSVGGSFLSSASAQRQAAAGAQLSKTTKAGLETAETQRSIARIDRVNNMVGANLTLAATRGVAPSSGSFKAVTQASFNNFEQDEKMDELNTALKVQYIDQQNRARESEADSGGLGGLLGNIGDLAKNIF